MAKVYLAKHVKEQPAEADSAPTGPFITISRQYGCYGVSLGLLLMEILNDETDPQHTWKIYHKDILARLATETNMAAELLERQRRAKPGLLSNLLRSLSGQRVPSGYEIRNRITAIIRGLASEGYAIIIGQGGAGATQDLPQGLSVRLEAPEEWRLKEVIFREGMGETEGRMRIRTMEQQREYLRKLYATRFPRKPAFHLVYDCSVFTLAQIAQQIVQAMKLKKFI